jgi:hypothetical protein
MKRAGSDHQAGPVTDGAICRWERLSGDSSGLVWHNLTSAGTAYDATLVMAPGDWPDFDGVGDYAHIGAVGSQPIVADISAGFTLDVWVKVHSAAAGERLIFMSHSGSTDGISLLLNAGPRVWGRAYVTTPTHANCYGATNFALNQWQHLAFVADVSAGLFTVYLNGVADGTLAYTAVFPGPFGGYFGCARYGVNPPSQLFDGEMDIARFYNRPLSVDEILRNYNAEKAAHQ